MHAVPSMHEAGPAEATFAILNGPALRLPVAPRLASFNKKSDPEQVRLGAYLDVADELLRRSYERLSGPLALRLDVGLPRHVDLLEHRDLDNYLYPLAYRLWRSVPHRLVSVQGTKQYASDSFVRIEQAVPAFGEPSFDQHHTVQATASSQSAAFKEQIRDQLRAAAPLPPGPVRMQLCFTVGAGRNWLNLWKPTIDALGQILGHESPRRPWSPCDGRVVELGLHCRVDAMAGNAVAISISVSLLAQP
jgi:hypothetical protein